MLTTMHTLINFIGEPDAPQEVEVLKVHLKILGNNNIEDNNSLYG